MHQLDGALHPALDVSPDATSRIPLMRWGYSPVTHQTVVSRLSRGHQTFTMRAAAILARSLVLGPIPILTHQRSAYKSVASPVIDGAGPSACMIATCMRSARRAMTSPKARLGQGPPDARDGLGSDGGLPGKPTPGRQPLLEPPGASPGRRNKRSGDRQGVDDRRRPADSRPSPAAAGAGRRSVAPVPVGTAEARSVTRFRRSRARACGRRPGF
jgi:hypothetical protein